MTRLNPDLPPDALADAYRRLARADSASLLERSHAEHRMLVDAMTVKYCRAGDSIAGAQAQVIDYDRADNNDWLMVNQFTIEAAPL